MPTHPAVRHTVDRAVEALGRVVGLVWFRRIESENLDRISSDRPVLVCINHPNGFVDPVTLVATTPRSLHFIAKGSLWKVPGVGLLLDAAGVLPVHRATDRDSVDNEAIFEACHRVLAADGAIGIFPEGRVNDTLQLKPLRTGAARIALGARLAGARGLRIVCVGLIYEAKARPRARVLVRAAAPIELDTVVATLVAPGASEGPDNHQLVDDLTALVASRLAEVSVDYDDRDRVAQLREAADVYCRDPEADPSVRVALAGIEPIVRRLDRSPVEARQAVLDAMATYQSQLDVVHLRDPDVIPGNTPERLENRLRLSVSKVAVLTPPALIGAAVNVVPYQAVRFVWTRPVARVSRANNTLLAGLVVFPVTWLAWALIGRARGLAHPWRLALLAGPATGHAAVAWWELSASMRTSKVQWRRLTQHGDLLADLRAQRATVVQTIEAALGAPAAADAAPAA